MNFGFLTTTAQQQSPWMVYGQLILMVVVMVALFYFMNRSRKKQEQKAAQMRNSLEIGDQITTIGGIVGTVVSVKDDDLVFETSNDKTRLRIKKWAIQSKDTISE